MQISSLFRIHMRDVEGFLRGIALILSALPVQQACHGYLFRTSSAPCNWRHRNTENCSSKQDLPNLERYIGSAHIYA